MTDIPIGSPPVPPGRHAAPSGWYPDPVDQRNERYWDGWQWARDTRPAASAPTSGPGQPYPFAGQSSVPGGQPYGGYAGTPGYGSPAGPGPGATKATTTADGVPLAAWGWRVLAAIIDYVFVSFLAAIPAAPLLREVTLRMTDLFQRTLEAAQTGQAPPTVTTADLMTTSEQLTFAGIIFAVGFTYHLLFLRFLHATPGKLIVGLRVVEADRGRFGGRLGWRPAAVRAAAWTVPQLWTCLLLLLLVDCLYPLWQNRRQSLHDLAARTQVIKHRRPG